MHDRYLLRGAFGVPYEFLWANPYQPGLSYDHAPLVWHNADFGRLFVRSDWDDAADWFGSFDGVDAESSATGDVTALDPAHPPAPLLLHAAAVCFGRIRAAASASPWTKATRSSSSAWIRATPTRWRWTTKKCTKLRWRHSDEVPPGKEPAADRSAAAPQPA